MKRRRKIKLQKPRRADRHAMRQTQGTQKIEVWDEAWPFVANPRGVLIHRVRGILQFTWLTEPFKGRVHCHADYWCENGCNFDPEDQDSIIIRDPGDGILCARCEALAVAHGQKTAEELAGHHVHTGGIRAMRFCCNGNHN